MKRLINTVNFCIAQGFIVGMVLLLIAAQPAAADDSRPDSARQVGDKVPLFTVVTNQGALADYTRDYYGQHHLVMTFFPAAFTPV